MPTMELLARAAVKTDDTWDLSTLFPADAEWETCFADWESKLGEYEKYRGRLGAGAAVLAECLQFEYAFQRQADRLGQFAFLRTAEDLADSDRQARKARFISVASRAGQAASYIRPELLALDDDILQQYLSAPTLERYRLALQRMIRHKPHTLSAKEEKLLSMQAEMATAASQIFSQLTDADMKFGDVADEQGNTITLSHSSFSKLLHSPARSVRQAAFHQYYREYSDHANALAATLTGSIHKDVYYARARNFPTTLESSIFDDNVPVRVVDNLIASVRRRLPALHRYYEVRRQAMKLDDIHHYDTYVPIISELSVRHDWTQATDVIMQSLAPMGNEYRQTLEAGLRGRWCDRYENKGKRSGAFCSGSYDSTPFILMNYQPDVLDHVFTLTHEAGHAMHSWHSQRQQPYEYHDYTIFVAEVASTFHEQLLSKHLLLHAKSDKEKAYYINREIDAIRGTIFRQTMFAEFENRTHHLAETGAPLTLETYKTEYRQLLDAYFGPKFTIDDELSLECLRIPHFYNAFYVYKYATGLSAAIALAQRVTQGGPKELADYVGFLGGGCSKDPLDLLRGAGVDLEQPGPVDTALEHFDRLVTQLAELLGVSVGLTTAK